LENFYTPEEASELKLPSHSADASDSLVCLHHNYPTVRVPLRIKASVKLEAESNENKSASALCRMMMQLIYNKESDWIDTTASKFFENDSAKIQASIGILLLLFIFNYLLFD
jgi:hypothetical protein